MQWIDMPLEQVILGEDAVEDSAQTQSIVVHSPGESTPESVALILRVDKKLTPHDVDMLMAIFRASYDGLLKRNDDEEGDRLRTRMAVTG